MKMMMFMLTVTKSSSYTDDMENDDESNNIQKKLEKFVIKAKSLNSGAPAASTPRFKSEGMKRKSFFVNDAVRSLDLALGRLKKSKIEGVDSTSQPTPNSVNQSTLGMFMDGRGTFSFNQSLENSSLVSMNFSHYELMRNLSDTNCNSDGAFSGTTNERCRSPTDLSVKDEHLEKYFRSIEMWSRQRKGGGPSNINFEP